MCICVGVGVLELEAFAILALNAYSGLLIFVTNESLCLLFRCHGLQANDQKLHNDLLLAGEMSWSNFWSWFLPSSLEKGLQLLRRSLLPSIILSTRCTQ